jgi:ABC-type uncharacterized transport system YnjBCD permease subunit
MLAVATMVISTLLGLLSALAFRQKFRGRNLFFHGTLLAAIVPGLTIGLGITLLAQEFQYELGMMDTGLLAHLIWTYPFSFVILIITFNRFDTTIEEAAAVLGANRWTVFRNGHPAQHIDGNPHSCAVQFHVVVRRVRPELLPGRSRTDPPSPGAHLADGSGHSTAIRPRSRDHADFAPGGRRLHRLPGQVPNRGFDTRTRGNRLAHSVMP